MDDAVDLGPVVAALHEGGPVAAEAAVAGAAPAAGAARRAIACNSHLLGPVEPADARTDILLSVLATVPELAGPVGRYAATLPRRPRLSNRRVDGTGPEPGLRRVLAGHDAPINQVAIAPDGTWLVTASEDGTARIWDPVSGATRAVLVGHGVAVRGVAIAADGGSLVTVEYDGAVRWWNPVSGRARPAPGEHDGKWVTAAVSGTGTVAVAADGTWSATVPPATYRPERYVCVWDGEPPPQPRPSASHTAPALTGNAGGTWLITAVDAAVDAPGGRVDQVVDAATGRVEFVVDTADVGRQVADVAPDRTSLAVLEAKTVRIWDSVTDHDRRRLPGNTYRKRAVFSPDGTVLATAMLKVVQVWDVASGGCLATVRISGANADDVMVAPGNAWLAAVCSDRRVRILDVATGKTRRALRVTDLTAAAIEPGGEWLATGGLDGAVRLWDAGTGRERTALRGHGDRIAAVAVTADGGLVAGADTDGLLLVWDVATGTRVAAMRTADRALLRCRWLPDDSGLCVTTSTGTSAVYTFTT